MKMIRYFVLPLSLINGLLLSMDTPGSYIKWNNYARTPHRGLPAPSQPNTDINRHGGLNQDVAVYRGSRGTYTSIAAVMARIDAIKSSQAYIDAVDRSFTQQYDAIMQSRIDLTKNALAITNALLSGDIAAAVALERAFNMPNNLPPHAVKATERFMNAIANQMYCNSGNEDVLGAMKPTLDLYMIADIYKDYINELNKTFTITTHELGVKESSKYYFLDQKLNTELCSIFEQYPAYADTGANATYWTNIKKLFAPLFGNPYKVGEVFRMDIQGNHYNNALNTIYYLCKAEQYQSALNYLNSNAALAQRYHNVGHEIERKLVAQEALKQQRINALAANPDLAYQYTTTTQPLLTTSITEQAAPSNPIAQQAVSNDVVQQQAPINDVVTQPITINTKAMQSALSQAASELESQEQHITIRFSPRLAQLLAQQAQTSMPTIAQQAESSTPAVSAQHVDILSPAAQTLLDNCELISPRVHAVAPEHQLFIQRSEVVLNNAAQAHRDGTVDNATIAETIVLTRTAQELKLTGHSDKAETLLIIAEKKWDGIPQSSVSQTTTLPDICDDHDAELAAFQSFGRVFGHTGRRIAHNVKHPMEFVHRQVDGLKNLTLLTAKSLNTFAKFLSEDPDLGREACGDVASAAQAIWEAAKTIGSMSEHEREEFFGNLLGDSLIDIAGLKAANAARQSTRCISSAVIEGAAQTFKGNKPLVPLYENALKRIPKPAPLEAFYDPKTNSWRVPDASSSTGIQKSTGLKVPGTSMTPTRIVSGTCKMPPSPKFANPHSVRKRTTPSISAQAFPATAATSSAGSKQTVDKVIAPIASSSGAGHPTNTTQQPLATPSNVSTSSQTGATPGTGMQKADGVTEPVINKKNFVEVQGYEYSVPAHTAQILIQADPYLEAIFADVLPIAKLYDLTRTGFADFATKYIKLTYKHVLSPEFGVQRSGNVKLTGFHHDMHGTIEQSGIITLIDKTIDDFGCYAGKPVFNGQTLSKKTFFPQSWSREKVINKIFEAYDNFKTSGATDYIITERGTYEFTAYTNEGIKIQFDITKNGVINTCYPIVN